MMEDEVSTSLENKLCFRKCISVCLLNSQAG